ncbi:MAG TPA: 16S rRNA (guanine(527)-N(7))-methyltransferase RsmG [Actinophytocola sp.]|uniref:16S rRNA (guanine(527)-N(7))-methyltransferase RsmG n=1 Tax=Actinophytocola sp. TaxID=1872138 RepID=UPI002DBD157F|nr:16S rRNA (guanine(527)-N(7))-methyltransferase RsmG [Actinophytocola sp.]HEU5473126.1 16S rRNA (guanine(527)-N(7))-methyltransferase RsmG [Actinophytocola sp.]
MAEAVPGAEDVFGPGLARAVRYAELLAEHGVERGLIGPREVDRLWDRHLLNSAVIGELVPRDARVVDLGSGAGLPGVPLAIAAPDLEITLLEPMARRVEWLEYVVATLGLAVTVVRGRAEEPAVRRQLADADVVVARAVAPLAKLTEWALPLLRTGGTLLAMKGASAVDEVTRDRDAVARAGGTEPRIESCGVKVVTDPATVVVVDKKVVGHRDRRIRKDR